MLKKLLLISSLFLMPLLPKVSLAQDSGATQLTENDFFNDFPVVLTATRLKQSKNNSPTTTTIIDREMIEASGFTEVVDLLRLAPGMLVNYDSGHVGSAGYQFLFDRYRVRLQILIDGMSVYTPLQGEVPWTQLGITLDDINRIEVIRGPSSASYGANAMTGVISIITRQAVLDKGTKLKAIQGVNGRSEQYFTFGDAIGHFDYRLSLGKRKDNGFIKRIDDKDLSILNFRGDYQASNNDVITISLSDNTGDYQDESPLNQSMPVHTKRVKHTSFQSKWQHNFSNSDDFTLHYYRQSFKDENNYVGDFRSDGYGFATIDEGVVTKRDNLEFTYATNSKWYKVNFGGLFRKDNTTSSQYLYNVNKDIDTRQFFINSEIHLSDSNTLNLNVLQDDNDTAGKTVSPRVALNHHINKQHTLRTSYAEATRSPFVFEEYTNRVIYLPIISANYTYWTDLSDLKPERIKTVDFGYIGMFNNGATEIDMRFYKNWFTDIIFHDWHAGTGGYRQGDEFNITGFESSLSHTFKNTKVILNYARTKIDEVKRVNINPHWIDTGAPEDIISLLMMHDFGNKTDASLGYYYTGSYQEICCQENIQSPRNRVDLVFSKSFKLDGYNSKIKFVLQNATDEYTRTRLYNNYHRQGYISFTLEL